MIQFIGFGCPQFLLCVYIYVLVTPDFIVYIRINIKCNDRCSYSVGNG